MLADCFHQQFMIDCVEELTDVHIKHPGIQCDLLTLLTMLHQWFTCVHLLDTYLANLTEDFQLSFTTHQFPSEQHKVVCNQHLHAECGGSATISLEVTTEIYQI